MRRDSRSSQLQITNYKSIIHQRGYMMLTLMLALALMTIGLLTILPAVKQQILRDREDEMRHRGTSYMRAIQHFYKKFGRYPNRIEDLENTNNLRFLRKRYKDPMNVDRATGKEKDFKLLHQTDISLNNGPVLGQIPGLGGGPGGIAGGGLNGGQQLNPAQQQVAASALNALGGQTGGVQQTGAGGLNPGGGEDSASAGADGNQNSPGSQSTGSGGSNSIGSNSASSSGLGSQTFGGGAILGVASASKAKTIRVFYEKTHYNDWLFIYVPQADRGGLLTGPVNPGMPTGGALGGAVPGLGGASQLGGQGLGQGQGQGSQNGLQPQTPAPAPQNNGPPSQQQ